MYSAKGYHSADDLLLRHAPLVKRIAYHLLGRLPASVQVDDLIQAGMIGLLDAARQYDESQGASFETYANIRIRGAMLDELRRNDWVPKSVHRKARELSEAMQRVEHHHGRDANDQEIAAAMGISLEEYHQILHDSSSSRMVSLDELNEGEGEINERFADAGPTPAEEVAEAQFRQRLAEEIGRLPEREKLIMALYYDQELNLKEIGAVLNVTESRVSQLLSQAHTRLRSRMSDFR